MKTIVSRDNESFKALRVLASDAREQRRQGRTVLDGAHLVGEYRARVGLPQMLVVSASGMAHPEIQRLLGSHAGVEQLQLRDTLFADISGVSAPVGILSVIAVPPAATVPIRESCVLLENVQDAGNVGTILRSAAAAGVRCVLLSPGCAGVWTPRVLRAAQGAHFGLDLREQCDLARVVDDFPGLSVATLADGGESLYNLDLSGPVAWIFGNEGAGITRELANRATKRATIPMAGQSESLNVAAAMAVCVFEGWRQRLASSD